jgi:O-antigen/teichoic acid export membrane protein
MGVIQRQGFKQTLVTYAAMAIGTCNVIFIYPKFLDVDQLGLINFILSSATLLLPFFLLGSNTWTMRHFPYFRDNESNHRGFLFYPVIVSTIGILLGGLILFGFKDQILGHFANQKSYSTEIIKYIFLIAVPMTYSHIFFDYSANFQRIVVPTIFNDLFIRIAQPALVLAYHFDIIPFENIFDGLLIAFFVILVGMIGNLIYLKQFHLKPDIDWLKKKPELVKDMKYYSSVGFIAIIGNRVLSEIGLTLLGTFSSMTQAGIYTIPFFMINFIDVPRKAISKISTPILAKAWAENDHEKIKELYEKSGVNQFIAGALIFVAAWVCIDDIFHIIPNGEKYMAGKYVFLFLGINRMIEMMTGMNNEVLSLTKYLMVSIVLVLSAAVLNLGLQYFLIKDYGAVGSALATLLAMSLFNLTKLIFIYKKFKILPFSDKSWISILLAIVASVVGSFFPDTGSPFLNIAFKGILVVSIFLGGCLYFKVSPDLTDFVKKLKKGKINQI